MLGILGGFGCFFFPFFLFYFSFFYYYFLFLILTPSKTFRAREEPADQLIAGGGAQKTVTPR